MLRTDGSDGFILEGYGTGFGFFESFIFFGNSRGGGFGCFWGDAIKGSNSYPTYFRYEHYENTSNPFKLLYRDTHA